MKTLLLAPLALLAACSNNAAGNTAAPAAPVAAKPAPAGHKWSETVSRTAEGYVMGNPDAPIKMVEYGSRLCPTCGALAREGYGPLTANYVDTGKVSFEFRDFLVHGPADLPPALIGLCVDKAAFFPLLEAMFQDQEKFEAGLTKLTPAQQQQLQAAKPDQAIAMLAKAEGVVPWMQAHGMPAAKAQQCLANRGMLDQLTKQTQDKTNDGTVTGTPTVLINGRVATGAVTWPQVEQALKAAGA